MTDREMMEQLAARVAMLEEVLYGHSDDDASACSRSAEDEFSDLCKKISGQVLTASEIIKAAPVESKALLYAKGCNFTPKSMGRVLADYRGQRIRGWSVSLMSKRQNTSRWMVDK